MNKFICKILLYIAFVFASLFSFFNFYMNGYCQALPDYIVDTNNLSVIEGGLGKSFDLGLSGPSNLFTIPIWTEEVLNPYLSSTFGWDTNDAAGYILEPLDPEEDEFVGTNTWRAILGNSSADEYLISQEIESGFRLFGWSPEELGKLATVIGTGGMLYFKGKIGEVTGKITDIGSNMLIKLGNNFSSLWGNIKQSLIQNDDIYNSSTSNAVYYSNYFMTPFNDFNNAGGHNIGLSASFSFSENVFYYSLGQHLYIVFPETIVSDTTISCNGSRVYDYYKNNIEDIRTYTNNYSSITVNSKRLLGTYNNLKWYSGEIYGYDNVSNGFANWNLPAFSSLSDITNFLSNNSLRNATSVEYVDENGDPFDLQSLLDDLNGKYVTTDQLGNIKTLIDNNSIIADNSGARQIFTDDSIQDLIDAINDILNQQDGLSDELTDPLPDPDPSPDPNPDFTWPEPPDYIPEWMYGPIPDLLPNEMFSIFQPVFDIVGTNYSMHSTFIAIPAILIVAFVIYFIVSVL